MINPVFQMKTLRHGRSNNGPLVAQLVRGRAGIRTPAVSSSACDDHYTMLLMTNVSRMNE